MTSDSDSNSAIPQITRNDEEAGSGDLARENIERLKALFPHIVADGKVDFDVLRQLLGDEVEEGEERYGLNWKGKRRARAFAMTPSLGTLLPAPEDSVDWDTTQNIMIEGDNLEVLKLLRRSYAGRVKLIYIDPPYNTGNDFVYADNYVDPTNQYLISIGERDADGAARTSQSSSEGRFHTNWLNMAYPRLLLARELLREDGFLAVSIDEGEESSLRKICDDALGEECFIGKITWERRTKAQNTQTAKYMLQRRTESILVYSAVPRKPDFRLIKSGDKQYAESDEKGSFRYYIVEQMSAYGRRGRSTMQFAILGVEPGEGYQWKVGKEYIDEFVSRGDAELINGRPALKIRPDDEDSEKFKPFWSHFFDKETYGTAETGKSELSEILGAKDHGFETVKPTSLIRKLIFHTGENMPDSRGDDIIMDFFAGSGSTGHSVMKQNAEDGENRRFVLVQIPEPLSSTDKNQKETFAFLKARGLEPNIAELTKERLRRAGERVREEYPDADLDTGFRVYKLSTSNLKPWQPDPDNLEASILDAVDNVLPNRSEEDLLVELLLKTGIDLAMPEEKREIAGQTVHALGGGALMVCLGNIADDQAEDLGQGMADWVDELDPAQTTVYFKDSGIGSDGNRAATKANLAAILRQRLGDRIAKIASI